VKKRDKDYFDPSNFNETIPMLV